MKKKLTKSRTNVVISGTLGGIAEYFNIDPTLVRVIYIVLTFVLAASPILLYILLMLIIPSDSGQNGSPYRNPYGSPYRSSSKRERKEAEKVKDDEDWSDF